MEKELKGTRTEAMTATKALPRYAVLDGLRGVAALMVLWYHFFEGFAKSPATQIVNHGYLCVDFFFMLSGFVIGFAYDGRWQQGMTVGHFMKRRLIRLHPMVAAGVLIGAVAFIIQGAVRWDGSAVSPASILGAMGLNLAMLPALPDTWTDLRGNGEMFSLNGPHWSLLFEYIGSLAYGLIIRKLNTRALALWTAALGCGLACYALTNQSGSWHLGVGWTLADSNLVGGLLRMMFAFSMGLLLWRVFKPLHVRHALLWCSVIFIVLVAMPFMGTEGSMWLNALYDVACIMLFFPVLVWLGASATQRGERHTRLCNWLGELSYPVYAIHYPTFYLFFAWLWATETALVDCWWMAFVLIVFNILLAMLLLRYYDRPMRALLSRPRPRVQCAE